jgi:hypothetical protein
MIARRFLRRSCGSWTSERRYLFAPKLQPVNLTTDFTIEERQDGKFVVNWQGKTEGEMVLDLQGDVLHRSRDYFGDGANSSKVEMVDQDCIVMKTSYDGCRFRESVRLIEADCFRLRQTIGFNIETNKLVLVGQYHETRL